MKRITLKMYEKIARFSYKWAELFEEIHCWAWIKLLKHDPKAADNAVRYQEPTDLLSWKEIEKRLK